MIETLVAIFMLVMGLSAAVGLAIYALNSSTNINKQIIAAGLAREGIEAVKNMRDTNWLQDTLVKPSQNPPVCSDTGCYNYIDGCQTAQCYQRWLGTLPNGNPAPLYCLDPTQSSQCKGDGTSQNYYLSYDMTIPHPNNISTGFWSLQTGNGGNANDAFSLQYDPTNSANQGFYFGNGKSCGSNPNPSDFCRRIIITKDSSHAPYNHDEGPLLKVQSQVWWIDKKCPRVSTYDQASPTCRIEMDNYLTNWKDY